MFKKYHQFTQFTTLSLMLWEIGHVLTLIHIIKNSVMHSSLYNINS